MYALGSRSQLTCYATPRHVGAVASERASGNTDVVGNRLAGFSAPSDAMPSQETGMRCGGRAARQAERGLDASGVAAIIDHEMARLPRSDEREEKKSSGDRSNGEER